MGHYANDALTILHEWEISRHGGWQWSDLFSYRVDRKWSDLTIRRSLSVTVPKW